jgi:hypothetical protein
MLHSDPYGPEATYVPPQILSAANSGVAEQIGIILEYLKQVPAEAFANYSEYGDEQLLKDLPVLKSGLEKIAQGFHPVDPAITDDEFMLVTGPGPMFNELAETFDQIAFSERMAIEESRFIRVNLQQPLAELARLPLVQPLIGTLVGDWAQKISVHRAANKPRVDPDFSPS